ncbi:hypothetical protein OSB04_un000147 [Centaurea solstitialis]|uniref:Reverse transcriptase domain-containing protein n=1 Tax=Centaurea solstitialis TaxID=347529 RepID=A0AA38W3Y5_9ASTR|nr:hypothetical protein OSB04_un000147 [Centaurea solstitialis]
MFKFAMWNIRGLNSPIKQRQVNELLKEYDISCCAIIETHVHANSLSEICSQTFGNWHWCSNHLVCDHGTRIILAWDMRRVDVVTMEIHAQFIHCQIRLHGNLEPFFVSCIYGENRTVARRGLWSGLRKFKVLLRDSPWLIMGDFNTMLFPHDGLGGSSRRSSDMSEFAECLMDIDVYDVHYTGVQYTWCQKPSEDGGIKRKLDRVMANNEFTTRFSDVTVQFLPRGLSDHSAAITSFMGGLRQFVVPFKFDNFLTNDHRFYDIVASGWKVHVDGTFMHRVLCKLKALKTPIRKLRSSFHNLTKMTASLKHELEVAQLASDLDPTNGSLQEDVCGLRHAYLKACYNEEQAIKQRAKIRWLLEGDSNTKFFHQVVKEKRHVHHIHSVMDASGRYVYSQEVPDAFVEHLKLYLGVRDDSLDPTMQPELFTSKLSLAQALDMIRPITDDDIKQAMFSIGSDKAPGSDGYSSKFFKKAWHIVGPEVSVAIHNFFYRGHLAKELNHTLVCLLPKNPNATRVSDFRPISCCSTLYKCISKVIVTRMKSALDTVVGKYQSAFIPGRKIVDNILLAHELVIGYQKDAGQPRCAFKIDIRKAYDMVDWRFLITMLENLGFHPVLINWIKEMVSTTTYSVAINGESRGYFHGKRGIRQGDPLSPYLFTLIMEGFSLIFRQCINEAEYFGYHKGCAQFHLTHLCFADDLFVFTRGDVQSVEVLKKALSIFEAKSGLSANLDKSEVFFGNVPLDTRNAIRTCLPFRNGIFPIRYLGVPLSPVRLKRSDYGTLILKVKNRIQNWKAKFLSFGGRMQLINSVLHSLQLYWMGVFNFPAAVIHEIEGLFRSFLWHQDVMGRGNCRVAWDMVCKPKVNGGLGFKRLGWWNKALLAQHLWDLATKRESLWVRWVLCDAFKGANMWIARKSTRWSWVLTKIMEIRPLFRMHIHTTVGNGVNTNAWNDTWLSCGPLSLLLSSRFVHENGFTMETTVADLGEAFQGHWPVTWINRFDQLSNIAFPALEDTRDVISWLDDANPVEDFKVSMAYKAIQGEQMEVPWHRMVWFKGCIPKHAFCLWLACWRRLPTQDRMMAWKEEPPDYSCSLCKSCVDSHSHLFFMCSYANEVWKEVTLAIGWQNAPMAWDDMLLLMSDQATAPKRLIRKLAISATVYEVWIERNKRLFTEERRTSVQITKLILSTIKLREEWKTARKITTSQRVPFQIVQQAVKRAWGKYGFSDIMMNANGVYFLKFNDVGGCEQVVEQGPLFIRDAPLFVFRWDPSKGLSKPVHTSCPLWVKLHDIPLAAFNVEGIGRIASVLGVPKQMDSATAAMCDKSWGRPGFAKVLVDTWATGDLKREIDVEVPSLQGEDSAVVKVRVEYIWEPAQCNHCMVFGHKKSGCAKAIVDSSNKLKPKLRDDDGFTRVTKKQWVPKANVGESSSVAVTSKPVDSGELPTSNPFDVLEDLDGGVKDGATVANVQGDGKSVGDVSELVEGSVVETSCHEPILEQLKDFQPLVSNLVADSSKLEDMRGVGGSVSNQQTKPVVDKLKEKVDVQKPPIRGILKNPIRSMQAQGDTGIAKAHGKGNSKREVAMMLLSIMPMFNIACWNIRGMNAPDKQQEVRAFLRNNGVNMCAILETHVRIDSLRSICDRTFGRWEWVSNQAQSEFGTRILIAWDVAAVDVMVLEAHGQYIHCEVRLRDLPQAFFVSFIYGANRGQERKLLWSGLRKFKAIMGAKPWVIAGDFNCLLFPHDALGGISRRNSDMLDFASCLEDIDVFDVRFVGIHHTWCQKPKEEAGLKRKLDRILANLEFTNLFVDATVKFLPRGLSDHSPGIIGFTGGQRARKYGFKFDNFLVNDPMFRDTVQRVWSGYVEGNFMFRVVSKLKALKTPIRKLRSAHGNLSTRTTKLKDELDVAQLAADFDPHNIDLQLDVQRVRFEYQKASWADLSAARQRAKVRWLSEGDANTRYFHKVVEEKRHTQHIHSICKPDGTFVYDDEVVEAFIEHFVAIIGTVDGEVNPVMPIGLFENGLVIGDALHMVRPILDSEIRDAIFCIGNDKAPGSDGYSSKFFKAAWEIVGNDVLLAIHNLFYNGRLLKEVNHTLLCLLPKSPNASMVSDFRPIACCSVLYKCISKIIADRMKPYLDLLVSKTQSAFIPGRRIVDNILLAHELVHGYHLEHGPPRCAFKIDLRKAYDMVNWEYLFGMLRGFSFHPVFIKWITEMVSTPSFSIVLNGESRGHFVGKRGIRQGDPLSPYLFTLVMEGFSMLFKRCIQEATNFGYHFGCEEFGISHLCFADDLFVFTRGDVASVEILKKALSLFAMHSGLSPNLQKSDVFFGNVAPDEKQAILHCLPFRLGSFPIRYLGVPLSPVALKSADYGVLVTKIKNRLANWKSKFLSFGGRQQLITSVLQSLQLYWMAIFVLPTTVVHEIESLIRDFLWTQGEPSRGKCKVAWNLVCRPKDCGGLGFKRLSVWNRALVTKNLWSVVCNRDCAWVLWIVRHSFRMTNFWVAKRNNRWSWLLTKMMHLRKEMRDHVSIRIGNGVTTNAWEDAWLSCGPLSSFVPYRFVHTMSYSVSTSVRQLLDTFHDGWPDEWLVRYPILANVSMPTIDGAIQDVPCWDLTSGGVFSVQRVYGTYIGNFPLVAWADAVWFKGHIPKHSFCLWLACLYRLPTQDRILEWKHDPPDLVCSLCNLQMDSHNHLFFQCTFSRQVWVQVLAKINWIDVPCSWDALVDMLSDAGSRPKLLVQKLTIAAAVYHVWCERNRRLFQGSSMPIPKLVHTIHSEVLDRVAWKSKKSVVFTHDVAT